MNLPKNITVRVYGLVVNNNYEILLSDELVRNREVTKFPGGGLELGESTIDTLNREFMEELNQEIEVKEHFYTTDFFSNAFGISEYQLIGIFYLVKLKGKINFEIANEPFDKLNFRKGCQSMRWMKISEITKETMTFPLDSKVALMIKEKYNKLILR